MGVDLSTYRARIGSFASCRGHTRTISARFSAASILLRTVCLRPSFLLLSTCFALLLLCAGDVEANPGPKIDDVLALMREFHDETTATLAEIKNVIQSITSRMLVIEGDLNKIAQIETKCEGVGVSVLEVKSSITKVNEELTDVVDDMNNRMRRNNLIVRGLPETEKEGYEESEKIVKEFFSTHLKVQAGDIERAHRVGKRRPDFDRPIIIKFLNFKSKTDILRNAPKLKNLEYPKVWIDEDFSPKVQIARKKLRDFAKENRTGNERFSLRFNCLYIWDRMFRYESSTDSIVEVTSNREFSTDVTNPRRAIVHTPTLHRTSAK